MPPTLLGISPIGGPPAGNTAVTLTGMDFQDGATVAIAGLAATSVVFVDSTMITARTPPHAAPFVADITVTNPDGQSSTLTGGYTYRAAPTVGSVSPATGTTAGGRVVAITGANFAAGATVAFGGADSPSVTVNSLTSITATTPPHAAGPVDVMVTNLDTQSGLRMNGYTYTPLTVNSVDPTDGPTSGGTLVTINGANFTPDTLVYFGVSLGTEVAFVSDAVMTARTPPHAAGPVPVELKYPGGARDALPNAFRYHLVPSVGSVTPLSGPVTGGTPITIDGANFVSGATVALDGAAATGVAFVSATRLTALTPAHTAGPVNVAVTNPDGSAGSLPAAFTYGSGPALLGISPSLGSTSGGTVVTLSGTNFVTGATVTFGGAPALTSAVSDDRTISATTPTHAEGMVDVAVVNPDGQSAMLPGAFAYRLPPSLSGINPTSGPSSGGTPVTLNGTNLAPNATVTFGGAPASNLTWVSASAMTMVTPAHSGGGVSIVVTNPDGQSATLPNQFTYQSPQTPIPDGGMTGTDSGSSGCSAGFSLPSLVGLIALSLWLMRRRRAPQPEMGLAATVPPPRR